MKRICVFCDKGFDDTETTSSEDKSKYGICPVCVVKIRKDVKKKDE